MLPNPPPPPTPYTAQYQGVGERDPHLAVLVMPAVTQVSTLKIHLKFS